MANFPVAVSRLSFGVLTPYQPIVRGEDMQKLRILLLLSALALIGGCSDGSNTPDTTPPTITRVGTGITTVPPTLPSAGGMATVVVDITDASLISINSVKADVLRADGTSLLGGAQPMISFSSVQNRWGYQATLPANTTAADTVYRVTVTASDIVGNTVNPAFVVGTFTVPHP